MAVLYLKYIEGSIPFVIHGALCLIAYIFWSALAVIAIPLMTVFRLFKFFEKLLIIYQKLGTVFSTLDIPFLHETENNRNFIMGMVEVQGEPNVEKLRRWVLSRLFDKKRNLDVSYQRLSQKISRHYLSYVWKEEENFNIKQHIPIYKGTLPKNKKDLEKLFSKFTAEPFPKDISPWMFRVVPSEDKKSFVLFCKFHHVIGDGFAMVGILSQLVDEKPRFINIASKRKGFMSNPIRRVITGILTGPLALLALVFSMHLRNPFRAKATPEKKTISWSAPISLNLVKKIKENTDSTVNDVLMSCLAGSIREYLINTKNENPIDLPIAMTFNQRSVSDKAKTKIPLGNHSGGLFLNLPIATSDPIKRLHLIKKRINRIKNLSHPHLFSFIYFNVVGGLPEFFGRFSTYSIRNHVSLLCSNVPGPIDTLYLMKNPVKSIVISPPMHADLGLVVSYFSYNNLITLTVMSDEQIISEPSLLTEAFERQVQLLGECTLIDD